MNTLCSWKTKELGLRRLTKLKRRIWLNQKIFKKNRRHKSAFFQFFIILNETYTSWRLDPYIFKPVYRSIGIPADEIDKRFIFTGKRCGTRTKANPLHRHSNSPCKKHKHSWHSNKSIEQNHIEKSMKTKLN